MLRAHLFHVLNTKENEWLAIGDTGLEYTIADKSTTGYNYIKKFSINRDKEDPEGLVALNIRPKDKISPLYTFLGVFVGTEVAVVANGLNVNTVSIIDKSYVDKPNPVSLAMLKLGYPEFSRIEDPNISKIQLELTGRDALKIKDIIIPDKDMNVVIACKYGRSWFYNYKNELPWYCDFEKATLEDVLSIAANVNKLRIFAPEE